MIITISGAGCTGKTTLMNLIRQKYEEDKTLIGDSYTIHIHEEFIREVFDKEYSNKYNSFEELLRGDPFDTIKIHESVVEKFLDICTSINNPHEVHIFDRSPLDASIYLFLNMKDHLEEYRIEYMAAYQYIISAYEKFLLYNPIQLYTSPFKKEVLRDGFRPDSLINMRDLEVSLFNKEFLSRAEVISLPELIEDRVFFTFYLIKSYLQAGNSVFIPN